MASYDSMPRLWVRALLGAALAGAVTALVASGDTPENPLPVEKTLVAVVDMGRVLAGCKEWQDAVQERARMLDTAHRTLDKLVRKDQVLRNEYENLAPGTDERQKKADELQAALQEYDQSRQQLDEEAARQHEAAVRSLFAKLNRVVAEYAKEHDIRVVLKKQGFDLSEPQSVEQSLQIATTEVLYADPALDISGPVLERLNAEYTGPIEVK